MGRHKTRQKIAGKASSDHDAPATVNPYGIVAFGPNSWLGPWMSRQQILSRLGKSTPIVYSTGLPSVWDQVGRVSAASSWWGSFVRQNHVWINNPPRALTRWPRLPIWDYLTTKLEGNRLRRFLRKRGSERVIAYVFGPEFAEEVEALDPDYCVYHAYDLFDRMPGWSSDSKQREALLLSRADVVIASSATIADRYAKSGRLAIVIPNAADTKAFGGIPEHQDLPVDLARILPPRIGYTGNLNRKVDFSLVEKLASRRRDWNFIFIGQVGNLDQESQSSYERCKRMANVHFLGPKSHLDLPAYVHAMDVNIICYRLGPKTWTHGIYPLKLHEYLAAGKPVVSSNLPSIRPFRRVVAIADNERDWERLLEAAICRGGVGDTDVRRMVAGQNDWDVRVSTTRKLLDGLLRTESDLR